MRPEGTEAFEKDAASLLAAPEKANEAIRLLSIRVGEKDFALPGSRNLSRDLHEARDRAHVWRSTAAATPGSTGGST